MNMSGKDLTSSGMLEYVEMGVTEGISYILFKNPVSSMVIDSVRGIVNTTLFKNPSTPPTVKLPPALENLPFHKLVFSGNPFIRLAGLSGASAVILGAYGVHSVFAEEGNKEQKRIYQTAHTFHFIHSLALFGVPLCRFPKAAGSLFILGMLLFCGTCYYNAFTRRTELRKFTPIGGYCLIFGWLCLVL